MSFWVLLCFAEAVVAHVCVIVEDVSLEELREATGEVNLERLRPSPSRDDSSESDDSSSQCTCLLHSDSELSLPQPPPWQPKVHERSPVNLLSLTLQKLLLRRLLVARNSRFTYKLP